MEIPIRLQALVAAPVQIDPGAILGPRAVVLPGVHVGAGAKVGAQAVVESDVPAGAFVEGVLALTDVTDAPGVRPRAARRGRRTDLGERSRPCEQAL